MKVSGWYILMRLEALEVVKNSTVKVIKALQTLARLCSQIAGDIARHRSATHKPPSTCSSAHQVYSVSVQIFLTMLSQPSSVANESCAANPIVSTLKHHRISHSCVEGL